MSFKEDLLFDTAWFTEIKLPESCVNEICNWMFDSKDILFFCGNPGIGKTHFCFAYAKVIHILKRDELFSFRFYNALDFFSFLREAIKAKKDFQSEIRRLCDADFFILDDIGSTKNTEWEKECFLSFLDIRMKLRKPTLITSNSFLEDNDFSDFPSINSIFGERVVSRLRDKKNTIIELIWEDQRI